MSPQSETKPEPLKAYALPGAPDDVHRLIRPARPTRKWMDRTPERYAYRCIPLSAANTMGWEVLNPVNCEFRWNGLTPHQELTVYSDRQLRYGPRSHFGTGVVTWDLPFMFRTPPDYGMVVTGPANHDRTGIVPLEGFVRTDWLPFPFTMNWRITTPDTTIRFDEGEPIARIFPYPLGLLEDARIELHELSADPEFERQFRDWARQRQRNYRKREEKAVSGPGPSKRDLDELWNRQYARGVGSDDSGHKHQTVFRCRPVADKRSK